MLKDQAEYILTSTRQWHKSLEYADYTFIAPKQLQVDSLSYTPDSVINKLEHVLYYFSMKHFIPDRNFVVRIKDKE